MSEYTPKIGDTVRLAVDVEILDIWDGRIETSGGYIFILRDLVSIEKVEDPEPPAGSVVLDGDVWQRTKDGWETHATFGGASPRTWSGLQGGYGPIRVIHTP